MSFAFIEIDLLCKVLVIQLECDRKLLGRWGLVIESAALAAEVSVDSLFMRIWLAGRDGKQKKNW